VKEREREIERKRDREREWRCNSRVDRAQSASRDGARASKTWITRIKSILTDSPLAPFSPFGPWNWWTRSKGIYSVNVGRRFARARRTVVPEKAFFPSSKGRSRKGAACDRDVVYRSAAAFTLPSTVTYRAVKGGRVAYRFAAGTRHGISSGSLGYCSSLRRETSINREYPMSINAAPIREREREIVSPF